LSGDHPALKHLETCQECRLMVGAMREQNQLLRNWQAPAELKPPAGFYARVQQRIEAQKAASIWNLFAESVFGRTLATASLALVLLAAGYVIASERASQPAPTLTRGLLEETYPMLPAADFPAEVFAMPATARYASADFNRAAVLVNLVSYQEQ
jgi:predicted anti-sigma-YlaC factor YlaD